MPLGCRVAFSTKGRIGVRDRPLRRLWAGLLQQPGPCLAAHHLALLRWSIVAGGQTDPVTSSGSSFVFAGFRFPREVISLAVRWYLRYGLSYRDVEELLAERGIAVDHVTIYRWVQRFTPEFIEAARPARHLPATAGSPMRPTSRSPVCRHTCTGPSTSMARSSMSYCLPGATWRRPGGSSPGRYAQAPSRPRSPPTAHPSTRGSWMSWSPRPCTRRSSTRTTH